MWQLTYTNRPEFICSFDNEQDYVDAAYILIIYMNFGILLDPKHLLKGSLHC